MLSILYLEVQQLVSLKLKLCCYNSETPDALEEEKLKYFHGDNMNHKYEQRNTL